MAGMGRIKKTNPRALIRGWETSGAVGQCGNGARFRAWNGCGQGWQDNESRSVGWGVGGMSGAVWVMAGAAEAWWRRGNLRVGSGGDGGSQEDESSGVGLALRGRGGGGVGSVRKITGEWRPKKT